MLGFLFVVAARWRYPRTDVFRGAALVFGLWLVIDGIAFSAMQGGMHAYYTLAVAPAVIGSFVLGLAQAWRCRDRVWARAGAAVLIVAAGGWGFVLLGRNPDWQPWLRWAILAVTAISTAGLAATALPGLARRGSRRAVTVLVAAGVLASVTGTSAYAVTTLPRSHTGGSPVVGPDRPQSRETLDPLRRRMGMLMGAGDTDPELVAMLSTATTTWSAAIDRSGPAAELELAGRTPVLAIGGFTSEDPVPTLAQFQDLVRNHRLTYYLAPDVPLPDSWQVPDKHPAPGTQSSPEPHKAPAHWHPVGKPDIYQWVSAHYTPKHIGSLEVYTLTDRPH